MSIRPTIFIKQVTIKKQIIMSIKKQTKVDEYTVLILGLFSEMFSEDSDSEYKINAESLQEDDNLTDFFQALSNAVPCHLFNKFTGSNNNMLQFNHIANQLVFQYLRDEAKN